MFGSELPDTGRVRAVAQGSNCPAGSHVWRSGQLPWPGGVFDGVILDGACVEDGYLDAEMGGPGPVSEVKGR